MKAIKYILAGLVLCGGFASCSLDEDPKYTLNGDNLFGDPKNAELNLLACYAYMTETSAFGQWWQEAPIRACGLTWGQRNGGDNTMNQLDIAATNTSVALMWKGMYAAIGTINTFIDNLEPSSMDETDKAPMLREAKTLRGICYYYMVTHFGAVPLKVSASVSGETSGVRDSREKVFEQVIADLSEGLKLGEAPSSNRVSKWTAEAMLAKTYMRMAQLAVNEVEPLQCDRDDCLAKAEAHFANVVEHGPYSLEPNFAKLWGQDKNTDEGQYYSGSEAVFMLACTVDGTSSTFNRGSNRFAPTASTRGISWGTNRVQKFVYDWHYATYPEDPRIDVTYLTKWRARKDNNEPNPAPQVSYSGLSVNDYKYTYPYWTYANGETFPDTTLAVLDVYRMPYEIFDADAANPDTIKFQEWLEEHPELQLSITYKVQRGKTIEVKSNFNQYKRFVVTGNSDSRWPFYKKMYCENAAAQRAAMNILIYRYGELLLDYADVENELGKCKEATDLVNQVLQRARQSGKGSAQPADWPAGLAQDALREKIFLERILETIGEPNIYDNVRMMGIKGLKMILEKNNSHQITIANDNLYRNGNIDPFCDYLYNDGLLTDDYLHKNLLFPIPSSEIDANSSLTNADNNFGY